MYKNSGFVTFVMRTPRDVECAPKIVDFLIIANAHNRYYKNIVIAQLPYA